jgi:hypothetical protein
MTLDEFMQSAPRPENAALIRACTCHDERSKQLCQHKHECVRIEALAAAEKEKS